MLGRSLRTWCSPRPISRQNIAGLVVREYNVKCFRGMSLRVDRVSDDEMESVIEHTKMSKSAAAEKVSLFFGDLANHSRTNNLFDSTSLPSF